jgi:adenylylsulfate kinase
MSGAVVWFTGKPSSGKSTLARAVADRLRARNLGCVLLDGDELRHALVPRPGYDPMARDEFYQTLANVAAMLAKQDLVVLVAATAHLRIFRTRARESAPAYVEVYVRVPDAELRARDAKGLYAAVETGRLGSVPGADLAYEEPEAPDVVAAGGRDETALDEVLRTLERTLGL